MDDLLVLLEGDHSIFVQIRKGYHGVDLRIQDVLREASGRDALHGDQRYTELQVASGRERRKRQSVRDMQRGIQREAMAHGRMDRCVRMWIMTRGSV